MKQEIQQEHIFAFIYNNHSNISTNLFTEVHALYTNSSLDSSEEKKDCYLLPPP